MLYICPKCGKPLTEIDRVARCEAGHSYDKSKEGYYNLLLTKGGGNHGDNKEMVDARRAFLDTGAYKPLADCVAQLVSEHVGGVCILDVGCGEGYYTNEIMKKLSCGSFEIYGFDISRDAIKYASKRNKDIRLSVASAYRMPYADCSFDLVTNMFSPLARDEIHRVLKQGGHFVMAIPGQEHLYGLKKATYKTPYKNEVADSELEGFELVKTETIRYNLSLGSNEEVRSLFMMTPYAYRTPKEDRDRVLAMESLETEIEFIVFVYKKL